MTTLTETNHAGEFILNAVGESFRDVTVLSGQTLQAGAVVGRVLRTLAAAPNPSVIGTGDGTMTNVKPGKRAKVGNYVVKCTIAAANGGTFSVTDPDGNALPALTLAAGAGAATNYTSDQISFTITDGTTDFAVDDTFTIAVTAGGTPVVVGTGNGTMSAISMGPQVKSGTYRVECTVAVANGGTFAIIDPDGNRLEDLVLTAGAGAATSYTSEQINFTITDGGTDFAVGDYFHIVVARPTSFDSVVAWDPSIYDGRNQAAGILYDAIDASIAAKDGVIVSQDAEVKESLLVWGAAITAAQKVAGKEQLNALGISIR